MGKLFMADIPDYRWDLAQQRGSAIRIGGKRRACCSFLGEPDYQWEQHAHAQTGRPTPRRQVPWRTQSDLTDYEPRMPLRKQFVKKQPKAAEDVKQYDESESFFEEEETESSQEEESESEVEEIEEDEEEEVIKGFNWATKKPMLIRAHSDITNYESNGVRDRWRNTSPDNIPSRRRSKRPRVRFSNDDPVWIYFPPITEEDKTILFWTRLELKSFRKDRDEERAERERKRISASLPDSTARLGSIWGSGPKKTPTTKEDKEKARAEKEKQEAAKKARAEKKAAEVNNVLDALQLAMQQANMALTGY